jgi:hypothetical protein
MSPLPAMADGRNFAPGGKTHEICEIFNDKCISFGAIMQALELLWFKEPVIQSMQG